MVDLRTKPDHCKVHGVPLDYNNGGKCWTCEMAKHTRADDVHLATCGDPIFKRSSPTPVTVKKYRIVILLAGIVLGWGLHGMFGL